MRVAAGDSADTVIDPGACRICRTENSTRRIVTYKSIWLRCDRCGCFSREDRPRYPLQWFAELLPEATSGLRSVKRLLGSRESGVDSYRYYESVLELRQPGKWSHDYREFRARISSAGTSVSGKALLDISGEPGWFGAQALEDGAATVTVTAYADNVASAIERHLGLQAIAYDFNKDRLSELIRERFDFISCRHALGYCEDLPGFFSELRAVCSPAAYLYASFSPPSLAVCSRWMFDDYAYLRQYTVEHVLLAAARCGFHCQRLFDLGHKTFDYALHPLRKTATAFYRHLLSRELLAGSAYYTRLQSDVGVLLRLDGTGSPRDTQPTV